jgi:hypothetical protein
MSIIKSVILVFIFFASGCTHVKPAPLIGKCLNWHPYYIDERFNRVEATPESVLISIDRELESNLLGLIRKQDIYKDRCWYRNVKTGGITLEAPFGDEESTYEFELIDGKWLLIKENMYIQIHT